MGSRVRCADRRLGNANRTCGFGDCGFGESDGTSTGAAEEAVGVCRSDLHFVDGAYPHAMPTIPGHEACGVVEAIDDEVGTSEDGKPSEHGDHALEFHDAVHDVRTLVNVEPGGTMSRGQRRPRRTGQ